MIGSISMRGRKRDLRRSIEMEMESERVEVEVMKPKRTNIYCLLVFDLKNDKNNCDNIDVPFCV